MTLVPLPDHDHDKQQGHNLIYQNVRILVGDEFLNNWVKNDVTDTDYLKLFKNYIQLTKSTLSWVQIIFKIYHIGKIQMS